MVLRSPAAYLREGASTPEQNPRHIGGGEIQMIKLEISLHINRPVAEVLKYLNDPTKMSEGNPIIEEARASEPPVKAGTRIRTRARMLGRKVEGTLEVLEYEPNKRVVQKSDEPFSFKVTNTFQAENGGTRLVSAAQAELGGVFKLHQPNFSPSSEKEAETRVGNPKEIPGRTSSAGKISKYAGAY